MSVRVWAKALLWVPMIMNREAVMRLHGSKEMPAFLVMIKGAQVNEECGCVAKAKCYVTHA